MAKRSNEGSEADSSEPAFLRLVALCVETLSLSALTSRNRPAMSFFGLVGKKSGSGAAASSSSKKGSQQSAKQAQLQQYAEETLGALARDPISSFVVACRCV